MSCFHNARERSVGKIGDSGGNGANVGRASSFSLVVFGNIASRWTWVAAIMSWRDDRESKSRIGYQNISIRRKTKTCVSKSDTLLLEHGLLTKVGCGSFCNKGGR
jgi:hypothetical protein